jgi:hypothetical protein
MKGHFHILAGVNLETAVRKTFLMASVNVTYHSAFIRKAVSS